MKKYLITIIISLVIGFFMSQFLLKQYNDYQGIKVYNEGELFYFMQYGIFDNVKEMDANTINLENYIYQVNNDKYYVYVGISKNLEITNKVITYFKKMGYDIIIKEFYITNKEFSSEIDNYDKILNLTEDDIVIGEIMAQTLNSYEEVVNESKN